VLDIVDGGLGVALRGEHDPVRDLLRLDAVVAPDDGGDRDADVREDVGRGVEDRIGAHHHDQHGQHQKGVGPPQR
jgi:hypothetical protein